MFGSSMKSTMASTTHLVVIILLTILETCTSCPSPQWPSFPDVQWDFRYGRWYYKVSGGHKNSLANAIDICGDAGARVVQVENSDDFTALLHYALSK